MIIVKKCLEMGLPEPGKTEEPLHYTARMIAEGHNINALICRHIGIYNLREIVQQLWALGTDFEVTYSRVYCPLLNCIPPDDVIGIYMTPEQQRAYWKGERKPIKEATQ